MNTESIESRLSEAYSDLKDKYSTLKAQYRALQKEKSTDEQVRKLSFRIGELESENAELRDQVGKKPKGQQPPKGWTQEFARDYLVIELKKQVSRQHALLKNMYQWRERCLNLRARLEKDSKA